MTWIDFLWPMVTGACLVLGLINLRIAIMERQRAARLWFSISAFWVAAVSVVELRLMRAESGASYEALLPWGDLATWATMSSLTAFVWVFFGTGNRWLALAGCASYGAGLLFYLGPGAGLLYLEITGVKTVETYGGATFQVAEGVPNPWGLLGYLGVLLMLAFAIDASLRLWRRGNRRRAFIVGGSLVFFLLTAGVQSALIERGIIQSPYLISWFYLAILIAMGHELSLDVLRAARLALDLKTSEQRLKHAAAAARLALWEWDILANRIWITDEGRALYGFTPEEEIDFSRFASVLHAEDRPSVNREVKEALARSQPFAAEFRVIHPNGEVRWITAGGRVERDTHDRATLMRGVSMDVTDRKLAEEETARHRYELAHLSRVTILGELAGAIAHELNQPLAAVLSNSQVGRRMLDAGPPDLVEMRAILDDIAEDAKRAGGIIHGMRAMFKKDASTQAQPVDLNEAVNQAVSLLHSEIVNRKVHVDLQLGEALPAAKAGRVEIQQVLINLMLNSIEAVRLRNGNGRIEICTTQHEGRVLMSVRDNGPGIAAEVVSRLFEPFASTKPGGLGLGLAISRTIARQFGGEMMAENHPDGGAVFRLYLPVQ